jgi:uncharacterized membrane protein
MKLYVAVTGTAFLLLFLTHVARVVVEGWHLATGVMFVATSVGSLTISVWAFLMYRQLRRRA